MGHLFDEKKRIKSRIKRIRGQLDAVERSLDAEKECFEVLQTLAACRGAINGLLGEIVEDHIREHIMTGSGKEMTAQDKEAEALIKILKTYWK